MLYFGASNHVPATQLLCLPPHSPLPHPPTQAPIHRPPNLQGPLWEWYRQLHSQGWNLDCNSYSTCFRWDTTQQRQSQCLWYINMCALHLAAAVAQHQTGSLCDVMLAADLGFVGNCRLSGGHGSVASWGCQTLRV